MSFILTSVFGLLSKLPGLVGSYFEKKQELEKIRLETQQKIALETQKLAAQIAKANAERAVVALGATGARFKYVVFGIISVPFVACLVGFPEYASMVFEHLRALPEWYMILYTSIVAVIWGIPVQGSIVGYVFEGLKKSAANRREYKLAKVNRKDFYDGLRAAQGFVSDQDVSKFNKILSKMDK